MDAYRAISIWDGFADGEVTKEEALEAARFIRDHGPRGVLAGNGTRNAIELADYADAHGDDEAIERM